MLNLLDTEVDEVQAPDTVERLLAQMERSPGFAGLGASVQTISRLGEDTDCDARTITETILRDAALTARLLRLANSSRNALGGRNITTVDQALAILGLNTVKSVALSLALLNSLSRKPQSNQLHAEIVAAYFCGMLASEVTRLYSPRSGVQEAQVCGLMQNLGRMMLTYYMYADIETCRNWQAEHNVTEDDAVMAVLHTSFQNVGAAIAKHWCLSDTLLASLAPLEDKAPPRSAPTAIVWHQINSNFCREVTDVLFRLPEAREKIELGHRIEFFRVALHLKDGETRELIGKCLEETDLLLADIGFPSTIEKARILLRKASERVVDRLSAQDGLTKDRNSIDGRKPVQILQHFMHLIHDRYSFDRTVLLVPEGASGLIAIAGVGRSVNQLITKFRCHGSKPDLFRAIMTRKLDTYIASTRSPAYQKLLPDWYAEATDATSFVMLPLLEGGNLLGMVYGDYTLTPDTPPTELAGGDMRDWREMMVQALLKGTKA